MRPRRPLSRSRLAPVAPGLAAVAAAALGARDLARLGEQRTINGYLAL